jgi:hypothetical protein
MQFIEYNFISQGEKTSSAIYSLIETCKANGFDPYLYLKQLLTHLPARHICEADFVIYKFKSDRSEDSAVFLVIVP